MPNLEDRLAALSPAKRRLLEQRLTSPRQSSSNASNLTAAPIAVVGMACRFPGARDLDEYSHLISSGQSQARLIPDSRWPVDELYHPNPDQPGRMATKWACLIDDVKQFDPVFFGITPREAGRMDPQQRLLMQTCWEAMEHAAILPTDLAASTTGVFVGVGQTDYPRVIAQYDNSLDHLDAHCGTGTSLSICANRLSYAFDWKGPSVSIDTACSSGLVAVHSAMVSLRRGECDAAVVGAVNVCLTPETFVTLSKARMLSPTGACRPFDAAANGYVRGEGCGVVLLKRLDDAIRDDDRILAVVRGSAVNHGGRTSGITAPNSDAQVRVIAAAMNDAGVTPQQVDYVEAHGTGTPLGDPIEVEALAKVFGPASGRTRPLYLTSVKANIGHTEIAAGIAGFIKAVLLMRTGTIAPQIGLERFNPHLPLADACIEIPRREITWDGSGPRRAGVSSFGFGGTNAHVVLESFVKPSPADSVESGTPTPAKTDQDGPRPLPMVLPVSTRTETTRTRLADRYRRGVETIDPHEAPAFCHTVANGRTHFNIRAAVIAENRDDLIEGLTHLAHDRRAPSLRRGERRGGSVKSVAAMFTGQGSQSVGMGMTLYGRQPNFTTALDRCDQIIRSIRGESILSVIRGEASGLTLNDTYWTQPALFTLEYALAEMWQAWGITPAYYLGHSVGEFVAACRAGVYDLETGLQLICKRAELMQALPPGGTMAVIFAPGAPLQARLAPHRDSVSVAAFNGPANTTVAGTRAMVRRVVAAAEKDGARAKMLEVSHAFHSPLMTPILDDFFDFASQFEFHRPRRPIVSNLTGRIETENVFDAEYWRDHIVRPVRFAEGVDHLHDLNVDAAIEMGPSSTLIGMMRGCKPTWNTTAVTSIKANEDDGISVARAIADLYVGGIDLDWKAITDRRPSTSPRGRVDVPGYPMDLKTYWFVPDEATTHFRDYVYRHSHVTPMLGTRQTDPVETVFQNHVSIHHPDHLSDHRVLDDTVVPAAAYVDMTLAAAANVFDSQPVGVEALSFPKAMFVSTSPRIVKTKITGSSPTRRKVQIFSRPASESESFDGQDSWDLNATGWIVAAPVASPEPVDREDVRRRRGLRLDHQEFYEVVDARGLQYGPAYRVIDSLDRCDAEVYCELRLDESLDRDRHRYALHPAIGDGCMQAMTGAVPLQPDGTFCPDTYMPVAIGRVTMLSDPSLATGCYVRRTSPDTGPSPESVTADVTLVDADGNALVAMRDVRIQRVRQANAAGNQPNEWLYQIEWEPLGEDIVEEVDEDSASPVSCLVLGPPRATTDFDLAAALQRSWRDHPAAAVGALDRIEVGRGVSSDPHLGQDASELGPTVSIEELPAIVKEWAVDRPTRDHVHLVITHGLEAQWVESDPATSIENSRAVWTEAFRALAELQGTELSQRMSVWLPTRGARGVTPDDRVNPNQTTLVGLAQVASQELRQRNVRTIDFAHDATGPDAADALVHEMFVSRCEPALAIRDRRGFVPRLRHVELDPMRDQARLMDRVPDDSAYRLRTVGGNTVDSLRFETIRRRRPGAGEVEIQIEAAGLNFSDVLKSIGLYPGITDDVVPLGLECSGVVTAVGPDVDDLAVGEAVMGIVPHGFASHCVTSRMGLVRKPDNLDHEEAAAIPLAFLTAHHCLIEVARLQPGEKVLIHAGAGGVGLAAIQIAQRIGATIFATAGNDAKREYLRSIGVDHVMNSRTLEFADRIDEVTQGEGVDVVLNSLPGEAIEASLRSLAAYGRFVEIGKTDIYAGKPLALTPFQDNLTYSAADLDRLFRQRPERAHAMLRDVVERFESGQYEPPATTLFDIGDATSAFRYMSQRKNIGKIVVAIDQPKSAPPSQDDATETVDGCREMPIRGDASYLITGGMGALGLATARWLANRGAGAVLLMSRRDPDEEKREAIETLAASGVRVHVMQSDVADRPGLRAAIDSLPGDLPPIRGVFHAAGTLRDRLIHQMSDEDFCFPLAAKTVGTWNLHEATEHLTLDAFVLFSSASSVLGTGGQANYGAANAWMDGFARYRSDAGKPTVSINWGAFAGGGMAADLADTMRAQGVELLPVRESLESIPRIVASGTDRLTVFRADWDRYGRLLDSMMSGDLRYTLIDDLRGETPSADADTEGIDICLRDELDECPPEEVTSRLQTFFAEQMSEIMGMEPDEIDVDTPLTTLGMDSLMAIELGNKMQARLGIEMPMSIYLEGPTIEKLASHVETTLRSSDQPADETDQPLNEAGAGEDSRITGSSTPRSEPRNIA